MTRIIIHVPDDLTDFRQTLAEALRQVGPDGEVVITSPASDGDAGAGPGGRGWRPRRPR